MRPASSDFTGYQDQSGILKKSLAIGPALLFSPSSGLANMLCFTVQFDRMQSPIYNTALFAADVSFAATFPGVRCQIQIPR